MKKVYSLLSVFMIVSLLTRAQEWTLKISSNVELRTWKLTTKADKEEKPLLGAALIGWVGGETIASDVALKGFAATYPWIHYAAAAAGAILVVAVGKYLSTRSAGK